jgi:hypothetical protein
MLASHQDLGSFLDKPPIDVEATIIGVDASEKTWRSTGGL